MVCVSAAGAFIAGAHYVAVNLPRQQNLQAPANGCQYPFGTLRTRDCYVYYCADACCSDTRGWVRGSNYCCYDANGKPVTCSSIIPDIKLL